MVRGGGGQKKEAPSPERGLASGMFGGSCVCPEYKGSLFEQENHMLGITHSVKKGASVN